MEALQHPLTTGVMDNNTNLCRFDCHELWSDDLAEVQCSIHVFESTCDLVWSLNLDWDDHLWVILTKELNCFHFILLTNSSFSSIRLMESLKKLPPSANTMFP
ncbi:MAG: hypothetical protein [Caudoviricetes sp.]|nr:MAG: hypothetical protein [Caudoviricetes sp.]